MSGHTAYASISDLSYSYSTPYSGGATLTITNSGGSPVSISSLSFMSNAKISGTPWGTLWGWQSTVSYSENEDGIHINYKILENPAVTIPPSQSVVLTYNIDPQTISGPFTPYNAAMDPANLMVTTVGSTNPEEIKIDGLCKGNACNDPGHGKQISGYFINWAYWRNPKYTAAEIPFDKINRVIYAFNIFDKDGKISLYDKDSDAFNLPIISQARKKYPYLNASLSFGGWSWASTPPGWSCSVGASPKGPAACFSALAANPTATDAFVSNAVKGMKELNFNGIDIDWEYPDAPGDAKNFIQLMKKLRVALDAQGEKDHTHYYLTIAIGAGIDKIEIFSSDEWQTIANAVDYIGAMTYDFHGGWDQGKTPTNFLAAMDLDPTLDPTFNHPSLGKYNVVSAMNALTNHGISPGKLLVGLPVYGRMVNIQGEGAHQGLYQPITGVPLGEWDNQQSGMTGVIDYACIVDKTACGNGFQRPEMQLVSPMDNPLGKYSLTPWGYSSDVFISFDDASSAGYKADWTLKNKFEGVMLWDLTGDFKASDERSIVNSIYKQFNK